MTLSTRSAAELGEPRPAVHERAGIGAREHAPRPSNDTDLGRYLLVLGQLVLLIALTYRFQLESESFRRLLALTAGGFAVHYFLPLRHRLGFFVALSFAGIVMVLGPVEAAWLIGIGLALIGICHLPLSVLARVGDSRALTAIGLAILRIGVGSVPWSAALWPILGSMFVFRLMVYLYDRSHETTPPRLSQTLGYFFLLPNVCFPLFPVVDFKKFCRNYYDEDRHSIYQVGVEWIWRGLLQLILYRVIYYHFTLDPVAVADLGDLVVYMLSTFLLYVRMSGQFHIIVGMLHLFGFNLPETHHRYFLASSFTDFWRRINIYWKDFMMKVFYYPAFFRLRKLGDTQALVLATAFTFRRDLVPALRAVVLDPAASLLIELERRDLLDDARAAGARELAVRDAARPRSESLARRANRRGERRTRPPHDRHVLRHLRAVVVLDRRIDLGLVADGALGLDTAALDSRCTLRWALPALVAGRGGSDLRRLERAGARADQRPDVRVPPAPLLATTAAGCAW